MRGKVVKKLKEYALYECLAHRQGMLSWKFYKKLKQAYTRREVKIINGVPILLSTAKPVVLKLSTRGTVELS